MVRVLKFRYFLWVLLLAGCGDNPEKKPTQIDSGDSKAPENLAVDGQQKTILFYGNSLTAAYGLDPKQGFPNLIQQRLDSLGLNYRVINSGLSGETTAGGLNRLDWVLNQPVDIFVLELGANDGLRGIPLTESRDNLQKIIERVKDKNSETQIILAGMQIPPNMGEDYTAQFREMYPSLAKTNDIRLIPFLLEDVAGIPSLNQEDGIHPTAEAQKILASNVWEILGPVVLPSVDPEVQGNAKSEKTG